MIWHTKWLKKNFLRCATQLNSNTLTIQAYNTIAMCTATKHVLEVVLLVKLVACHFINKSTDLDALSNRCSRRANWSYSSKVY